MISLAGNPNSRARENAMSLSKVRIWNPKTGMFLHMSGQSLTDKQSMSWSGFKYQADNAIAAASESGMDMSDFTTVSRQVFKGVIPENVEP